jgi:O-antigen ligase
MNRGDIYLTDRFQSILLTASFICFGLFPILPNNLKGLPVVLLAMATLIIVIRNKSPFLIKRNDWLVLLVFSGLYITYFISMLYTEDIKTGFRRLETTASLILLPWCIFLIQKVTQRIKYLYILYSNIFFWSSTLFSIIIISYFYYLGYYDGITSLGRSMSWMDHEMWLISQHAIYASMFISVGLLSIKSHFKTKSWLVKSIILLAVVIDIYVLFLLLRKGVILALLLALIIPLIVSFKKKDFKIILLVFFIAMGISLIFKNSIYNRGKELFEIKTYQDLDIENSTSMRFVIYNCVLEDIQHSPIYGHGVGDGYSLIASCLKEKHNVVFEDSKQKKNSHNQFLGILLYTGAVGLLFFLLQLLLYVKMSVKLLNPLMLEFIIFFLVLFMTENLLDRQSGVILFTFVMSSLYYLNSMQNKKVSE